MACFSVCCLASFRAASNSGGLSWSTAPAPPRNGLVELHGPLGFLVLDRLELLACLDHGWIRQQPGVGLFEFLEETAGLLDLDPAQSCQ